MKNLDLKIIIILVLGAALIISFFFGQKNNIDDHKDEIKKLQTQNSTLLHAKDSIVLLNKELDIDIAILSKQIVETQSNLSNTETELNKLKNKQHEVPNIVNHLSGNGVSDAFTKYLKNRTTSKNSN